MHDFTPLSAIVGGALIAASLATMLVATGRTAGLSGVLAGFLRGTPGDWAWRAWFLLGMLGAGGVFAVLRPDTFDRGTSSPLWLVALSGVLVGVGTRLGNGCTSGHGLCGMSRLSKRSVVATLVFFGVGVATATIIHAGSPPRASRDTPDRVGQGGAVKRALVALLSGALFGAGVCVSGMVRPSKVLGFLDLGGAWDASLALVMASALALHVVAWMIVRARGAAPPPLGGSYPGPPSPVIDARLIGGALLFGVGWGLSGFCPGPAMVSIVSGVRASLVFVGAMAVAMAAYQRIDRRGGDRDETLPVP